MAFTGLCLGKSDAGEACLCLGRLDLVLSGCEALQVLMLSRFDALAGMANAGIGLNRFHGLAGLMVIAGYGFGYQARWYYLVFCCLYLSRFELNDTGL